MSDKRALMERKNASENDRKFRSNSCVGVIDVSECVEGAVVEIPAFRIFATRIRGNKHLGRELRRTPCGNGARREKSVMPNADGLMQRTSHYKDWTTSEIGIRYCV